MEQSELVRMIKEVEVSEWFDWMRREITQGGIDLPSEEIATLFAAQAVFLAARAQDIYRLVPFSLRERLIKAVIVYQCWNRQKDLNEKTRWPGNSSVSYLKAVEALRYVRMVGSSGRHHLVAANDGFEYVITLVSHSCHETLAATEIVCNVLAELMGLTVPNTAVVALGPEIQKPAYASWARTTFISPLQRATKYCFGVRYLAEAPTPPDGEVPPSLRATKAWDLFGAAIFDVWVLNKAVRHSTALHYEIAGREEVVLLHQGGCLMGADWKAFTCATSYCSPAPFGVPLRLMKEAQLARWIGKVKKVDLNRIWELAFRMPAEWYGGQRALIAEVLDALEHRRWSLRGTVEQLMRNGHFSEEVLTPKAAASAALTHGSFRRSG